MADRVPADQIETIVGTTRHRQAHYARAVSAERTVYILHSQRCLDSGIDLRDCRFSIALDQGIDQKHWGHYQDVPVAIAVWQSHLIPLPGTEKRP